jgi:hypothetical protein
MMPVILDPGFVATEPMPAATGTKLRPRPQYLKGRASGLLYFRDAEGNLFEIKALPLCAWPEALTRDGDRQMELGGPVLRSMKSAAERHRQYRKRKACAAACGTASCAAAGAEHAAGQAGEESTDVAIDAAAR